MEIGTSVDIFRLLESCEVFRRSRREVGSVAFAKLRRAVRALILALRDSEDEWIEVQLLRLQRLLAKWLTTPCSFQGDCSGELMSILGEVERLCARWGNVVAGQIEAALAAAAVMADSQTPLQRETRTLITDLLSQTRDFRILCHWSVRRHFLECLPERERVLLTESHFLHSAREYRDCSPFDVLIKVGPLRSEGWGAAPSAVLNAPRFREMVQIVWQATPDDPRFGLDPVLAGLVGETLPAQGSFGLSLPGDVLWELSAVACGEEVPHDLTDAADVEDDLGLLAVPDLAATESQRRAGLVILAGNRGVLYPPGAFVLIFDPEAAVDRCFAERQVGDDVSRGTFLVWPRIHEEAGQAMNGTGGQQQEIWRALLAAELIRDAGDLARRLRAAGLNLAHPEAAARHWARPPSTVIHAPRKKRHFDILMRVLGVPQSQGDARPWADGWREVRQSRGEAIQAGVQEHARLMAKCVAVLRASRELISDTDVRSGEFSLKFTGEGGLYGAAHFLQIEGVEDGYRAPDTELRQIQDLDETVRWRV